MMISTQILVILRHPVIRLPGLALLLLLLTNAIVYISLLQPRTEHRNQLDNEVALLRNELTTLTTLGRRAHELQALSSNVEQLNQKLEHPASVLGINRLIQQLSRTHSIRILRQSNKQDQENNRVLIKQSLVVEGRYMDLRRFIDGIYHMPTFSVIQKADIQRHGRTTGLLSASISLVTYSQLEIVNE